ncbi:MAG: hypothetical protein L6282_09865 [Candidatus Methanoperedenaceae archaeon]|nr:hypothetical protein [Candidatus Methanoperedenaceae archaeon]
MAVWRWGYRYLHSGAGHACLSCGVCAIAAFSDDDMNDLLEVDGVERFCDICCDCGEEMRLG